jgi:hypothetical protein
VARWRHCARVVGWATIATTTTTPARGTVGSPDLRWHRIPADMREVFGLEQLPPNATLCHWCYYSCRDTIRDNKWEGVRERNNLVVEHISMLPETVVSALASVITLRHWQDGNLQRECGASPGSSCLATPTRRSVASAVEVTGGTATCTVCAAGQYSNVSTVVCAVCSGGINDGRALGDRGDYVAGGAGLVPLFACSDGVGDFVADG